MHSRGIEDILVVEDREENIVDAKQMLGDVRIAKSFAEFEEELASWKPDKVLSDLYFPTGYNDERDGQMRHECSAIIEDYVRKIERPNPIAFVLEQIFGVLDLKTRTVEEYLHVFKDDALFQNKGFVESIKRAYEEHTTLKAYRGLAMNIRKCAYVTPCGIFAYRRCAEEGIPVVIVTSAYHHGIEFQPFVSHVGPFVDEVVGGKKQWSKAFERLRMER